MCTTTTSKRIVSTVATLMLHCCAERQTCVDALLCKDLHFAIDPAIEDMRISDQTSEATDRVTAAWAEAKSCSFAGHRWALSLH